ncbi:hypothetical protein [Thermomonas sp.]|uniref:hypothetical protein n=1 Tax=Thermomonas sp. TaxID=1971895 RepID=UPI0026267A3C|nr:hypothetical protein [Thermomonas sp.]
MLVIRAMPRLTIGLASATASVQVMLIAGNSTLRTNHQLIASETVAVASITGTMPRSRSHAYNATVTIVFSTAPTTCTRAMSSIRRKPRSNASCPPLIAPSSRVPPRIARAQACVLDWNIIRLSGIASATLATHPSTPVAQHRRRSMRVARATATGSPSAMAMARTALRCRPRPVTAPTRLLAEVYRPITPTPAGPSSTATTLIRSRPTM